MQTLKKIFALLTPIEQKRAVILIGMILVMAFLDTIGVASILPFMAVLANPELVQTNEILSSLYIFGNHIGIRTHEGFLFALGVLVFLLLVTSLVFKAVTTYAQTRFALMREYSIGKRLVESYLHKPYSWFLDRHSAEVSKTILSEVSLVVGRGLNPLMTLIAQGSVAVSLLILLMIVDHQLAIIISLSLGLAYAGTFIAMRSRLNRLGQARVKADQERYRAVTEAFGAAKEIKVGGLERVYIQRYSSPAQIYARSDAISIITAQLPRYGLEAVAFGGMLLVILYFMAKSEGFNSVLPVISLYAFAGYRLMPALQQVYASLTHLRFARPAVDALHKELSNLQSDESKKNYSDPLMQLTQGISISQVSYRYPNASRSSLKGVDITISAKSTVGFVGSTGSGKTTMVDVVLGLLEPQEGALKIDGLEITATNRRQWQRIIGYIPQHIYLADNSVAANIAFGVNVNDIDQQAVERAAKIANLHEFVVTDLPLGYATTVGERGVRLSGGQRQRIGIARALYHNPQVLIMDEATSALDNLTEQAVMEAINNLDRDITVILVAHRLSTVRQCDQIYLLERGKVKASGSYDQLIIKSKQFAAMANHT